MGARIRPRAQDLAAERQRIPELNIFLANKQIYKEAQPIFYSVNEFQFGEIYSSVQSIAIGLAFLMDRPLEALRKIRYIGFAIEETVRTEDNGSPKAVLTNENHVQRFCQIVSEDTEIRDLKLHIRTSGFHLHGALDWAWPGSTRLDLNIEPDSSIPDWVCKFLDINNLNSLEIDWRSDISPVVGRSINAIRSMRAHMVKNGQTLKDEGIRVQMRHD
ncbi:uncharacterized protein BDZ99DRAFT_566726 [Mytilinidion resinicola]|uniref:Uncharacterized protein n=1 Tax=Mytilinidion resinicola TaxID=574789 RepID=A0A6A6Z3C5_9PEZI|nr:uncharacterized protein BDZ99DRAFT_566726 [Mytilinidion resinicola]KAF2814784.1 hypothetical protein BDZ99DRAFT_566726 [Mytilinidion resinicola]